MNTIVRHATRIPCTLTITALALAAFFVPGLSEAWQIDRAMIESGQWFRLVTCHLTHWNFDHLQWDLLMFFVLGTICELRNRHQMPMCVVAAGMVVSGLVLIAYPNLTTYRGLSGIDTALFTLLACSLTIEARQAKNRALQLTTVALVVGLCVKTTYELVANHTFFVDQSAAGFQILIWDHVVAGVIGACVAWVSISDLTRLRVQPITEAIRGPRL